MSKIFQFNRNVHAQLHHETLIKTKKSENLVKTTHEPEKNGNRKIHTFQRIFIPQKKRKNQNNSHTVQTDSKFKTKSIAFTLRNKWIRYVWENPRKTHETPQMHCNFSVSSPKCMWPRNPLYHCLCMKSLQLRITYVHQTITNSLMKVIFGWLSATTGSIFICWRLKSGKATNILTTTQHSYLLPLHCTSYELSRWWVAFCSLSAFCCCCCCACSAFLAWYFAMIHCWWFLMLFITS